MTGEELLNFYTAQRDFTDSAMDNYAQLLMTIWSHIGDDIYPLLEKAEKDGKKLDMKDHPADEALQHEWIVKDDIIFI